MLEMPGGNTEWRVNAILFVNPVLLVDSENTGNLADSKNT